MRNLDYLKWDAESLLTYLRRKLLESGLLTDQMYPGSDVKIIMDLMSYTFEVLTYMLNNSAADALFSDTQLYENMNRLVKILGYSPVGYLTSTIQARIGLNTETEETIDASVCVIPKFSCVKTGKNDKYGNEVKYSFVEDFVFNITGTKTGGIGQIVTPKTWPIMYNGEFKKYETVFTADGTPYYTVSLYGLNPNATVPVLIDYNHFHVYIEDINQNTGLSSYEEYKRVDSIVQDATFNQKVYEVRLDENKNYTFKFGDDVHGVRLKGGQKIHIVYLQSNGEDGKLDANEISIKELLLDVFGFDDQNVFLEMCFGGAKKFAQTYKSLFVHNNLFISKTGKLVITNINSSTLPTSYENVDKIRENAPYSFRSGNRLVTIQDYVTYLKSNFANIIHDIWVCNNATYTSTFYKWLYDYGKLNIDIKKYNYKYTDACDFNNIYLWIKPTYSGFLSDADSWTIKNACESRRTITSEIVPCSFIEHVFMPYLEHPDYPEQVGKTVLDSHWDPPIKIKITIRSGIFVSTEQVKTQVGNIFTDYFNFKNNKLGGTIDLDEILKQIYDLGTVAAVRTEYVPTDGSGNCYSKSGLSFACYTLNILRAADFEVITKTKTLLPFQFPTLFKETILDMIEIVND